MISMSVGLAESDNAVAANIGVVSRDKTAFQRHQ